MYLKIFATSILVLLLVIVQVAFISGLPVWFSNFNVVLVILIMILGFSSFKNALLWSVAVGSLWDMFSFSLFGLNMVALALSIILANFLLENFLTNRSLYTFLALTMSASVVYEFFIYLATFLFSIFFNQSSSSKFSVARNLPSNFWTDEFLKVAMNMILAFLLFYAINFFSKRFRPMFLIR